MTVEVTREIVCQVIEDALKLAAGVNSISEPVTMKSKMGEPKEWDSLSFVAVFIAVSDTFAIELDDDDAINFRDAQSIHSFLEEFA
jgi:acyl carrier protein